MSRVYGKKGRRISKRLESPIDLSPEKFNSIGLLSDDLEGQASSRLSIESEDKLEPLTSPFQSPIKSQKIRKLISPREKTPIAADDIFELREDEHKPKTSRSARGLKTRTPTIRKKEIEDKTTLNSFFVESSNKPTWSPKKDPGLSLFEDSLPSQEDFKPSPVRKLVFEEPSPKKIASSEPSGRAKENVDDDGWDLFDSVATTKTTPKKRLFKKSMLRSASNSQRSSPSSFHEREVLRYYSQSQSQTTEEPQNNRETPEPESQSKSTSRDVTESPKLKRTAKTYGFQRSFLVQTKQLDDKDHTDVDEDGNDFDKTYDNEETEDTTRGNHNHDLQTISHLRAQGLNAQSLDELNFILEGIQTSSSKISGLLDLSLKLFDEEFAKVLKINGLPSLHHSIEKDDGVQRYLLGFILCKISEGPHDLINFDQDMVDIVILMLQDNQVPHLSKGSKNVKLAFNEFMDKLNNQYTGLFFGLTLLLQNSLFVNKEIYTALTALLDNIRSFDEKCNQIILILLESYLSNNYEDDDNVDFVSKLLKFRYELDPSTHILTLKLLIVLSVKKVDAVYKSEMVDRSLSLCSKVLDDDLRLLYFGFLINLVEDDQCLGAITKKANLKVLHNLYSTVGDISSGYLALLIGLVYTKDSTSLITIFDKHELENLQLSLQRFDSKGNKNVQLQVETILTKFSI